MDHVEIFSRHANTTPRRGWSTRFPGVLMLAASLLAGCAPGVPSTPMSSGAATGATNSAKLAVSYVRDDVRQDFERAGFGLRFNEFWQAYVNRDWGARLRLERSEQALAERFYIPYHARAWALKDLVVNQVAADGEDRFRVELQLTLVNPENGRDEVIPRIEHWVKADGAWWHETNDPMLRGVR